MIRICGLILAGGRSRRFGREKAVAELGGEPLIGWVLRVLQRGAAPVAVNADHASGAAAFALSRGLTRLPDPADAEPGPLSGVRAGLAWAAGLEAEWVATAPCDTPFLPSDLMARLAAGRTSGGAVACTPEGLQPLCALWPVRSLAMIGDAAGHPPVREMLDRLGAATVAFDDPAPFANLNTPEDFGRARARLLSEGYS